MSETKKAVIKNADMEENMQKEAVDVASQALDKFNIEKDIAAYIKKEFDKKYNPTWHCIVGRNFGSYVTHESKYNIERHLMYQQNISFTFTWAKLLSSCSSRDSSDCLLSCTTVLYINPNCKLPHVVVLNVGFELIYKFTCSRVKPKSLKHNL